MDHSRMPIWTGSCALPAGPGIHDSWSTVRLVDIVIVAARPSWRWVWVRMLEVARKQGLRVNGDAGQDVALRALSRRTVTTSAPCSRSEVSAVSSLRLRSVERHDGHRPEVSLVKGEDPVGWCRSARSTIDASVIPIPWSRYRSITLRGPGDIVGAQVCEVVGA